MIKKRKDGRLLKTISINGKRYYFYGKTEREINKKILEFKEKQERGCLFEEIAWEWWDITEPRLAYQTRSSYKTPLKRLCEFFKDKPIEEIKPKDIYSFLYDLINKRYAQKTISNHKIVCNKIFEHGILTGKLETNPCVSVKLPKDLQKKKRESASNTDEEIILKSAHIWLFPFIALLTGMRKGEILALQWKDIDFKNNIIYVTKSIYYEANKPKIKKPKTEAGIRTIPLLQVLKEELLKHKPKNTEHFIICDENGEAISKKAFRYRYSKFQQSTGISCTAHQIRHSFATNAFEANVPIKSVQEILGHRQISTTMDIYTDFRKRSFDEATVLLNLNFKVKQ